MNNCPGCRDGYALCEHEHISERVRESYVTAVTNVLVICCAYESGVGRGESGRDEENPYPVGSDGAEAYKYGYDAGLALFNSRKERAVSAAGGRS